MKGNLLMSTQWFGGKGILLYCRFLYWVLFLNGIRCDLNAESNVGKGMEWCLPMQHTGCPTLSVILRLSCREQHAFFESSRQSRVWPTRLRFKTFRRLSFTVLLRKLQNRKRYWIRCINILYMHLFQYLLVDNTLCLQSHNHLPIWTMVSVWPACLLSFVRGILFWMGMTKRATAAEMLGEQA